MAVVPEPEPSNPTPDDLPAECGAPAIAHAHNPDPGLARPWRFPSALRALEHRNYRLFMSGQIISLVGYWMQAIALQWLVYDLTGDPFLLGLYGFAAQIPVLIFGLSASVVVEKANRHRLIIMTQMLFMAQALTLFALTALQGPDGAPLIRYWHLLALAFFGGTLQAFDLPARQSFLVQMVPKQDLGNAIAINSLSFNTARIVGPSVAGALIGSFTGMAILGPSTGEAICFALNGFSFLVVVIQLFRLNPAPQAPPNTTGSHRKDLVNAARYAWAQPHIGGVLLLVGAIALFGLPYLVLLPVFARTVFGGDSRTLGMLVTSVGIGALFGGLIMAHRHRLRGLGRIAAATLSGFAVAMVLLTLMPSAKAAVPVLILGGMCMVSTMIGSTTIIQSLVSEEFRGRILGFYMMMNLGLMPFGSLLSGFLADRLGARNALRIDAAACLIVAGLFFLRLPVISRAARATAEYAAVSRR